MELTAFDKNMMAIAFAEAGEPETARQVLGGKTSSAPSKKPAPVAAKKKPVLGMIIFGTLSIAGYAYLMTHQKLVMDTFTMGGWHAVFPVGTAFLFSFVHGAFSSNLLDVLGLTAKK